MWNGRRKPPSYFKNVSKLFFNFFFKNYTYKQLKTLLTFSAGKNFIFACLVAVKQHF